jgi:hypothetical protein
MVVPPRFCGPAIPFPHSQKAVLRKSNVCVLKDARYWGSVLLFSQVLMAKDQWHLFCGFR